MPVMYDVKTSANSKLHDFPTVQNSMRSLSVSSDFSNTPLIGESSNKRTVVYTRHVVVITYRTTRARTRVHAHVRQLR